MIFYRCSSLSGVVVVGTGLMTKSLSLKEGMFCLYKKKNKKWMEVKYYMVDSMFTRVLNSIESEYIYERYDI